MAILVGEGPVILVDDNEDALRLASAVFGIVELKNTLLLLNSGTKLVAYLEKVQVNEAVMPSVVLLDINMPTPNGFETLKKIRDNPTFAVKPKIIMLTASNDDKDKDRALTAGANDYQVKPFDLTEFLEFAKALSA